MSQPAPPHLRNVVRGLRLHQVALVGKHLDPGPSTGYITNLPPSERYLGITRVVIGKWCTTKRMKLWTISLDVYTVIIDLP
jgi:hypothetical protein